MSDYVNKISPKAVAYGIATFAVYCLIGSLLMLISTTGGVLIIMHPLMLVISGYVAGYHAKQHGWINGLVTGALAPLVMIYVVPIILLANGEPGEHDVTLFGSGFTFLLGPVGLIVLLEGVGLSTFGGNLWDLVHSPDREKGGHSLFTLIFGRGYAVPVIFIVIGVLLIALVIFYEAPSFIATGHPTGYYWLGPKERPPPQDFIRDVLEPMILYVMNTPGFYLLCAGFIGLVLKRIRKKGRPRTYDQK